MSEFSIECPICKKGQLKEYEKNYRCDFFKSMDDKCNFIIWKEFYGKNLSNNIIENIIKKGHSGFLNDFKNKEGVAFTASLFINEHNKIAFLTEIDVEGLKCVACDGKIIETSYYYKCENTFDESCAMKVPKVVAKKNLDKNNLEKLIRGETTDFIDGFKTKTGNSFSAKLYVSDDDFSLKFDGTITNCPKCEDGLIRGFEKVYSCSNYKNEKSCDFSVWRFQYGGEVSRDNIVELCNDKRTKPIDFTTKEEKHPYQGILVLDDEFKVVMEKVNN